MVFPSVPIPVHLDHSSWLQQQAGDSVFENLQLTCVPPSRGDGGTTVEIRPCSMSEQARLAKLPYPEAPLKCPRCESTNTKFCYFNNYSLSQPRHFCKTCRRYWTRGGALRDVPVGGGFRRSTSKKSKGSCRSKSPITSTTSTPVSSNNTCSITNKFITNSSIYSNLPFFPSLPNVPELQDAGGNELGFPIDKPSANTGTLNLQTTFGDQWISASHQMNLNNQLSCLSGRFDQSAGAYNFERETINPLIYDDQVGFMQLSSSLKQEENEGTSLSRNYMRLIPGNDQYWSGNTWKDLSAASSASHFM